MSEIAQTLSLVTGKREVVEELGEPKLTLPSLVALGLEANGRAKYLLSLLQAARARADAPSQSAPSLRDERLAAGVADPELDRVVAASRQVAPDVYAIPRAGRVHRELVSAIRTMLAPLGIADRPGLLDASRLDALLADAPDVEGDLVPGSYVDRITSASGERDSLHRLVMDAHRALIGLQAEIATSSVDGAAVYGLGPDDRDLVAGFMAGVHRTAPLKFDHPGLATSATRIGARLLVQNDLGMTKAHVVVLAVDGLTATVTYTDVHPRRLRFFQSMVQGFDVQWSDTERRQATPTLGEHHVAVGRYRAADRPALESFLRFLGSRLVFVIDWNRARKRLGTFLAADDAVDVLRWAADEEVGHMAFLEMGAERLIYDAIELSARVPARYGQPLVDVLGREATLAITRFALRAAAEGMLAGKSPLLIRDELRVEVLRHVQASHRRLLDASADHASLIVECAKQLQASIARLGAPESKDFLVRAVARAKEWEHRADEILVAQREDGRRVEGAGTVTALTTAADDAIDDLEEAVFLLTLVPESAVGVVAPILAPVAAVAVATAREHLKAVEGARQLLDGSAPEDLEDFLVAVDQVASLEHDADAADRHARAALVSSAPDFRSLYVADRLSRGAEGATDALLRSALGLRDHILHVLSVR